MSEVCNHCGGDDLVFPMWVIRRRGRLEVVDHIDGEMARCLTCDTECVPVKPQSPTGVGKGETGDDDQTTAE